MKLEYTCIAFKGPITIGRYDGPGGDVIIPDTMDGLPVTSIRSMTFWHCSELTSVTIPAGVTSIGKEAFACCDRLRMIAVDPLNPVFSSVDGVLFNKDVTTLIQWPGGRIGDYTIPASVTCIGDKAFAYCRALTGVAMPASLIHIGDEAFHHCKSLTEISIPQGVTHIGREAFVNCGRLASVTIPASVTYVGEKSFSMCDGLRSVTIHGSDTRIEAEAFGECRNLASVTLGNGVINIGARAFLRCVSLSSVAIPASVTGIGARAFEVCDALSTISVDVLNPAYSSADGVLFDKHQATLIRFPESKGGAYRVPESVARIEEGAFEACSSLTHVTMGHGVIHLGAHAFAYCPALTRITLGDNVTELEKSTFASCVKLSSITVPDSVTSIGESAFSGCIGLTNIAIGSRVTRIGNWAFVSCTGLSNVSLPESVTDIGSSAFTRCASLAGITLPTGLAHIGHSAFDGCARLVTVAIPAGVTSIEERAFAGCVGMTMITVDPLNEVYSSVDGVLFNKDATTLIQVPGCREGRYTVTSGITCVEVDAFTPCTRLDKIAVDTVNEVYSSIDGVLFSKDATILIRCPVGRSGSYTIPDHVTRIGVAAFYGCRGLTAVTIGKGVTDIGDSAFHFCGGLGNITVPDNVISIGHRAFFWCDALTRVTIGNGVTGIGKEAFAGCVRLKEAHFRGNAPSEDWNTFEHDERATVYYLPDAAGWSSRFGGRPTAVANRPSPSSAPPTMQS